MFRLALWCLFGLTYSQVSAEQGTEAIVGGHYAKENDFKYHVYVHVGHRRCGGAIIADQYILTAAQCVTDANGHIRHHERIAIMAGTINIHHQREATVMDAQTVYIPKLFNYHIHLHDIAILKLKHSLHLSPHYHKLGKIDLPKSDAHFDNVAATFTGFGDQSFDLIKNSHGDWEKQNIKNDYKLKFGTVKVITNQKCSELNGRIILPTNICGQMIQDKYLEGGCDGDSGGPLVYAGEIIGVYSTGPFACAEERKAAVYTRVSSYLHFINSVIHGHPGDDVTFANVGH